MNLQTKKTAELRRLAEEEKIKNFGNLTREELIKVLNKLKDKTADKPDEPVKDDSVEDEPKNEPENEDDKSEDEPIEEQPEEPPTPKIIVGYRGSRVAQGSKAARIKDKLDHQTKVSILIPLEGDKFGSTMPVTINSYRVNILKGIYVSVPRQIAEIVMDSQQQTMKALEGPMRKLGGMPMRIDGIAPDPLQ